MIHVPTVEPKFITQTNNPTTLLIDHTLFYNLYTTLNPISITNAISINKTWSDYLSLKTTLLSNNSVSFCLVSH